MTAESTATARSIASVARLPLSIPCSWKAKCTRLPEVVWVKPVSARVSCSNPVSALVCLAAVPHIRRVNIPSRHAIGRARPNTTATGPMLASSCNWDWGCAG